MPAGLPSLPVRERVVLVTGLALLWGAGYFSIGWHVAGGRAQAITLPLDAQIPFVAQAIWPYLCVFPLALSPLLRAREARLIRRTALAYGATILVSLLCFVLYPISASGLRPAVSEGGASAAAVRVLYALDPPYNLCPSLHVSIAVLAAMSMSRALGRRAPLSSLAAAVVAVSTCLVKQHFLIDVFAGAALAALIGGITLQTHGGFHRDRGSGAGRAGESLRRVK